MKNNDVRAQCSIHAVKTFHLENDITASYAAGLKNGKPVVVFGVLDPFWLPEFSLLTLEYSKESLTEAIEFVNSSTEADALKEVKSLMKDRSSIRINAALSAPAGNSRFRTRGQARLF
ncbi:hypothetical protein ABF236_003429 [Yersinia ruckeri]|nr:hypothetical protein [Yersinia ruckeri]